MELQPGAQNPQPISIELEFVPEDERDADPAAVGDVGRRVVAALQKDGYNVQPVYTGKRFDLLFTLPLLMWAGHAVAENKDLLVELLKSVQPVIEYLFKAHEKKVPPSNTQGQVKVAVEIDGAAVSVEAPDVASAERLIHLANTFRTAHPAAAANITPYSKVKVRGTCLKAPAASETVREPVVVVRTERILQHGHVRRCFRFTTEREAHCARHWSQ